MKITSEMRVTTRIVDAKTGKIVKENKPQKNLVLDQGLNAWAWDTTGSINANPVVSMTACRVGSGNNPVKIGSGGVTFTQTGTTLTASAGFFTSTMVGGIFKWGTGSGGVEVYISAYTNATTVTVLTSAEVPVAEVGTVWMVQTTALQTLLYSTQSYQTNPGDNGSTIAGNTITHKRTFVFPVQASSYTVNEIGWYQGTSGTNVYGRLVLSSSDVVSTSNFYVVVLELAMTYSPGAPTAVADIGTNFDTSGTAMLEYFACYRVNSSTGASTAVTPGVDGVALDRTFSSATCGLRLTARIGATYTQNATPNSALNSVDWGTSGTNFLTATTSNVNMAKVAGVRGKARWSFTGNVTAAGQTCYGVGVAGNDSSNGNLTNLKYPMFDIKLTTPQVLPTGSWQPTVTLELQYDRTLTN